jgi:hypothetical protein
MMWPMISNLRSISMRPCGCRHAWLASGARAGRLCRASLEFIGTSAAARKAKDGGEVEQVPEAVDLVVRSPVHEVVNHQLLRHAVLCRHVVAARAVAHTAVVGAPVVVPERELGVRR